MMDWRLSLRWHFICSACSCRTQCHQLFSRNWSWHFNCWGAPTGDQLLGEQIGSSSSSSRFLEERLRRGEAVPWPRQRPTWSCVSKGTRGQCLELRSEHSDFPGTRKRLEAGFSGFILIRVKSETGWRVQQHIDLSLSLEERKLGAVTLQPPLIWH